MKSGRKRPPDIPRTPEGGWHLPAYRFRYDDVDHTPGLAVWCAWCHRAHMHGDTGEAITSRGPHCYRPSAFQGSDYTLIVVGRISSPQSCPRMTAAETLYISELLRRSQQGPS
jgi:hypothetical protein